MIDKIVKEALTFDDVSLVPRKSSVLPSDVDLRTKLTNNISLNIPFLSSAMDTVTESRMAIAMAKEGGMGIIHKNITIEDQRKEVEIVKAYNRTGIVINPITINENANVHDAKILIAEHKISALPVIDKTGKILGLVTNRDIKYVVDDNLPVVHAMTKKLITAKENISLTEAKKILLKHKIEKLLIIDDKNNIRGLITCRDIDHVEHQAYFPNACKDVKNRLRVGAAVSTDIDAIERVEELVKADVDVIAIDSAHGHSTRVIELVKKIKNKYPNLDVIAGNLVTKEAALDLIDAGADCLKVGIGPGSICTTRIVAGVGIPQLTAIYDVFEVCRHTNTCVIADGGIRFSGDIVKAIAAGADSVMIGNLFAGAHESPSEEIIYGGKKFKGYVGMGSLSAMLRGSKSRYFHLENKDSSGKLVPEGIEGMVPYAGKLKDIIFQLKGGLMSGMGYLGVGTILELKKNAKFVKISYASLKESHIHDVLEDKK
ncbi:IMP dehydrogenase (plasmid) [Borrelia miyamotoi]|uniref:Inosine-5'-monophosphate dehydrogenase n=2 Tax=Borrelia miyamotoi TaxID=47466 RepID=A0AAQ3CN53_9SPIR|nr:IMP dehydrogenase [Borrelia miyamotoi]AHH05676.1 Inosine-5'-monophosphate dehydrogenase [Borrelia miyamotoi FR64b]ATQ15402.1 IMP dehydrogenase [Borrelia miyamotoi]ATQ16547.1 IMP dehydrogenase [Borrelia miyamotoi]ATQ17713.1 IMP dehydrogenase [Borrelia miyamotoi]ATQ18963.1 IMP dehydrogenase [Borrelia miyamotoi]